MMAIHIAERRVRLEEVDGHLFSTLAPDWNG